ncbi:MAG: sulfite exporter TauE/SafE family protein [Cellvibrionaceae bacterium]
MEFILYIIAGGAVGIAIGMTGVGGGSLMTPLLILFGFPYNVAIGTDLLYAAITKSGGVISHHKQKNIEWKLVGLFAAGSIPASIVTILLLDRVFMNADDYKPILTTALGVMLILTSIVLLFRKKIQTSTHDSPNQFALWSQKHSETITVISGALLGIFVTLSSVGAGAFCAALLLILYPKLSSMKVVGTDIAHAVPLTFVAGLGHLIFLGNVDFVLLGCLLLGSLPAIHLGTKLGSKVPSHIMLQILASILMILGVRFAFF